MIWLDIVRLRIGRASPAEVSCGPFKLSLLDSNLAHVTLGESSCLPSFLSESNLYKRCYNLCARDEILGDPGVPPHGSFIG